MADIDPMGIINSETQIGPDGVVRRANEKVTRSYMQFGKYHHYLPSTPTQSSTFYFTHTHNYFDQIEIRRFFEF